MYDVVVKSSRSLSHLMMSYCKNMLQNCRCWRICGNVITLCRVSLTSTYDFYRATICVVLGTNRSYGVDINLVSYWLSCCC